MLKSYLKVALRHLRRQKGYAFINVFGLALGLACCLLIGLYLWSELSYDRHHEHADRIYRVALDRIYPDNNVPWAPVAPAVAAGVKDAHPEVVEAARVDPYGNPLVVRHGDRRVEEEGIVEVDPTFFEVFTVPFLRGEPDRALDRPDAVVLTEETARRYFGDADPLGETLIFSDTLSVTITAVVATPPPTSHFTYDFLRPLDDTGFADVWGTAFFCYTYILLREGASPEALETKFRTMERTHLGATFESPEDYDEWLASGNAYRYFLQPLTDIHLHSDLRWEIQPNSDVTYVYLFGAVALFVLLIAVINFMNLATARSAERVREVGMRKVLGSYRWQLIQQFLIESVMMSAVALAVALGIVALTLPVFEGLVGRALTMDVLMQRPTVAGLFVFTLGIGVLAGSYPAFYLSAFRPAHVLKGLGGGRGSSRLRNGLVVTQFAIAIVLMVGTVVVYEQVQFMVREKMDVGEDLLVVVDNALELDDQAEAFRTELLRRTDIVNVAFSGGVPSLMAGADSYRPPADPNRVVNMTVTGGDEEYIPTLGLELVTGRNFRESDFADTTRTVILNETAVRRLGLVGDPIGQQILDIQERLLTVVGVLKDFHFESLRQELRPLLMFPARGWGGPTAVRIRSADVPGTLAALEQTWTRFVPERPFSYTFLDDEYAAQYASEQATGQLFLVFAVLAVIVACLGLFGLAAFTAERRKKEIGIRKVIGAPVASLVTLVSREFVALVLLGFVLAAPVAYLLMNRWLEDFAYRVEIGLDAFVLAGVFALTIAVLTVSYHALRAATANPVDSLRTE